MDQKKSKEYWKKRAERQENKAHKEGDKLLKELDKNLTNARKEIQKSINDLVVRYMDLTELSYADAIKNLTSSEFKEWRMTLEEYMAEIEKFKGIDEDIANKLKLELETLAMKSRISRLDTLKAQIDMELNRKAYAEQEALKGTLETVYNDSYRDIRLDFGVESSVAYLDKDTLSDLINYPWSGTDFSNRIWENRAALGRILKEEIIQSFIQGISVKDLSDKIMGRMNSDRKNTERLVRTELNYALNQATKKGYEDSEVEEYEYLAEIDSRTSPQCRELNGKVFKLEDAKVGVNYPPMHPHCRSTTIPVIEYEKLKEPEKNGIIKVENKKIEETMETQDYNNYMNLINNNSNKEIQRLYYEYSNDISSIKRSLGGGTYSPLSNAIDYSYPREKHIENGVSKYSTLAHEFGHYFDNREFYNDLSYKEVDTLNSHFDLGKRKIFKDSPSSSDEFLIALQKDREFLKTAFKESRADIISTDASGGVQDALDGMFGTQDKRLTPWGHGDAYYNRKYNKTIKALHLEKELKEIYVSLGFTAKNQAQVKELCRRYETASEAWANICSAVTCGGKELEYTQKYLPNMYETFLKIIKNVKKKGDVK